MRRYVELGLLIATVLLLQPVLDAWAQPVAGATYTGDITGCADPPCGTVRFTVSGDASQVDSFAASDVPGDVCLFSGPQQYPVPLDIEDDSFGPGLEDLYEVSGSFVTEDSAEGTLKLVHVPPPEPPCDSGVLNWTATIIPVGGIAEYPAIALGQADRANSPAEGSASSARNYGAMGGAIAIALVAVISGAWYARRRWLR